MKATAFFITPKLFKLVDSNPIVTPAILDDEGNVITPEIVTVERVKLFFPKAASLYNTRIGYVGKGGCSMKDCHTLAVLA